MNVERLRAETQGCADHAHLNNAGAGLMTTPVLDARRRARVRANQAVARADAITEAYAAVGELVGVPTRRLAFTENATASFVQALSSLPFERGDVLLTTRNDYVSNQLQLLSLQRRLGVEEAHRGGPVARREDRAAVVDAEQ